MNPKELYAQCWSQTNDVIQKVTPADYNKPTPDTEWSVKVLANHMLYELAWIADMVSGKTIEQVGDKYDGDLIGDNLQVNWLRYSKEARAAIEAANPDATVHVSYGDITVGEYLEQTGGDEFIHAWDLAEGIGKPIRFDTELATVIYQNTLPQKASLAQSGLFAPALTVSDDADIQTKLLALFGRSSAWQQS